MSEDIYDSNNMAAVKLPALDVTEDDKGEAELILRRDLESFDDDSCIRTFDRLACRERQQREALAKVAVLASEVAALRKVVEGIANANYREWPDGLDSAQSFVDWAKSLCAGTIAQLEGK